MISIRRFGFNFISVPKNGSTSIRRFFIDNVVQLEDVYADYYQSETERWSRNLSSEHARYSHMDLQYAIDNDLIDPLETIVAVVREPFERLLSLYLYRFKQGALNEKPSVEHFRRSVADGYLPDQPWQNQTQASFLRYNGKPLGKWWLFEDIDYRLVQFCLKRRIKMRVPPRRQNVSLKSYETRDYLTTFYDKATTEAVARYYAEDIELYHKVKMTCSR